MIQTARQQQVQANLRSATPPTPPASDDGMGGLPYYNSDSIPSLVYSSESDDESLVSSSESDDDEMAASDVEIVQAAKQLGKAVERRRDVFMVDRADRTFASVLASSSAQPGAKAKPQSQAQTRAQAQLAAQSAPSVPFAPSQLEIVSQEMIADMAVRNAFHTYGLLACDRLRTLKENSGGLVRSLSFLIDGTAMTKKEGELLAKPTAWLCDNSITAFGKLLMLCVNLQDKAELNRIVVVDSLYSSKITMESGNNQHRSLVGMLVGEKTKATEKFLFPTNIKNRHWFLIVADIKKHEIVGIETFPTRHTVALRRVRDLLNANWDLIGSGPRPNWKLEMLIPSKMPLQKDTYNCGVYTCAFMDLIAHGVSPSDFKSRVSHRNIAEIRQRYAALMNGFCCR